MRVVPEEARAIDDAELDLLPVAAGLVLQRALVDKGDAVVLKFFFFFFENYDYQDQVEFFRYVLFLLLIKETPRKKKPETLTHASLPFIERPCQCSVAPT